MLVLIITGIAWLVTVLILMITGIIKLTFLLDFLIFVGNLFLIIALAYWGKKHA